MRRYVILVPPGAHIDTIEARVEHPHIIAADDHDQAAKQIRRIALEQELAALQAELSEEPAAPVANLTFPAPVANQASATPVANQASPAPGPAADVHLVVGADGIARHERHAVHHAAGPAHICPCGAAFYNAAAHRVHAQTCRTAIDTRTLRGHAEPGAHVAGATTKQFQI